MSQFIESIRIEDQQVFLLELHQERVNRTFAYFGVKETLNLSKICKSLEVNEKGFFKLRIVYDLQQKFTHQLIPYAVAEIANFQLMENNTCDYSFKYEERKLFSEMKAKAKAEEIIIVKNGCITDVSYANLLFLKDHIWYTPTTYLLNGVMRQHLLKQNKIKEIDITLDNISEFSHFQIINAMNDFDDMFIYPIERIVNLPEKSNDLY